MKSEFTPRGILKRSLGLIIFLWILGITWTFLSLVRPQQIKSLTEVFSSGTEVSWSTVNWILLILLAAQFTLSILTYFQVRFTKRLVDDVYYRFNLNLFGRAIRFSPEFFRQRDPEEVNNRILEESHIVSKFYVTTLVWFPLTCIDLIAYGAYMFFVNWSLALLVIPLAFLNGYFLFFDKRIQAINRESRRHWDATRVRSKECMLSVEEYRTNNVFAYGLHLLGAPLERFWRSRHEISALKSLFRAVSPVIQMIQDGVLLWVGAALCILTLKAQMGDGFETSWPEVIAFIVVAGMFLKPIERFSQTIIDWRMNRVNIRRLEEFEKEAIAFPEEEPEAAAELKTYDITFDDVTFTTQSGFTLLNRLQFEVPYGTKVALVGPAGCGKSTIMRMLVKDYRPSEGTIRYGEDSITGITLAAIASKIGYVAQHPVLQNGTIRENLLLGLRMPSTSTVEFGGYPLAIDHLTGIQSLDDLDRRIYEVIESVALTKDVFRKGLDGGHTGEWPRAEAEQLRSHVMTQLEDKSGQLIERFSFDSILWEGRFEDNLRFGLPWELHLQDKSSSTQTFAAWLLGQDSRKELVEQFLGLAMTFIIEDEILQTRLGLQREEDNPSGRTPRGQPEAHSLVDLETMSSQERETVLAFFLQLDSRKVFEKQDDPGFVDRVIQIRKWISGTLNPDGTLADFTKPHLCEALSNRERILLGRVRSRNYQATEKLDQTILTAAESLGLVSVIMDWGLNYEIGENGRFLSGGQRQKLALGRALIKEPEILFLDEATSALDEISQHHVVQSIQRAMEGKTVIAISHRLSTVGADDLVLVLDRGRLIQKGAFRELSTQPGLLRELLALHEPEKTLPDLSPTAASAEDLEEGVINSLSSIETTLSRCPLFENLEFPHLQFLAGITREVEVSAGEMLFHKGDPGEEFFVIIQGEVAFLAPTEDVSLEPLEIVDVYGPGESFGEVALFSEGLRTLGARANTDLLLGVMHREDFLQAISRIPEIGVQLLGTLARRIASLRNVG